MTVDEILADPVAALGLPDDAIPISVILLCEYAEPGSENRPSAKRLAMNTDDNMSPWVSIGMMRYAIELELQVAAEDDE